MIIIIFFCIDDWFGKFCEYHLNEYLETIIQFQFNEKISFSDIDISLQLAPLTCYTGLPLCNPTICLDWRQICDSRRDCENGEDESPMECLQLELNQCDPLKEYRCRNGMCIPRSFFMDFYYDCMDYSDEQVQSDTPTLNENCFFQSNSHCEEFFSNIKYFSCGDGQFVNIHLQQSNDRFCHSGRNRLYELSLESINFHNVSPNCWHIMNCLTFPNTNRCEILLCDPYDYLTDCYYLYEKMIENCGKSFFFQSYSIPLYPFVQYLYHNIRYDWDEFWKLPNYFCYKRELCPNFPYNDTQIFFDSKNLTCIKKDPMLSWFDMNYILDNILAGCSMMIPVLLKNNSNYFYCNRTHKFISKNLVNDGHMDCIYYDDYQSTVALSDDEFEQNNSTYSCTNLNLTDRFKCLTTEQCIPLFMLGHGYGLCDDKSDEFFIGQCRTSSDLACQFIRGDSRYPPVYYLFQENCNNLTKLKYVVLEGETDETSCEEWPAAYQQRYKQCDNIWDEPNGQDELNCPGTTVAYIRKAAGCNATQHYCAHFYSFELGCLDVSKAGDNQTDCYGNTDERTTSACTRNGQYQCSDGDCLSLDNPCSPFSVGCDNHLYLCPRESLDCEFTCFNQQCIPLKKQCDNIIDCPSMGEDEWFCDLNYKKANVQFSLNFLDENPSVMSTYDHHFIENQYMTDKIDQPTTHTHEQTDIINFHYCNRGVIITTRGSNTNQTCLCPPSYYGNRCQFQSERVTLILRIDSPMSLMVKQQQSEFVKLIVYLMNDQDEIVDSEQMIYTPLKKYFFYLVYPRPTPKQNRNWYVRIDTYSVTLAKASFKVSWSFVLKLSFLPVNRLSLHLTIVDQDSCSSLPCVYGTCKRYVNVPHNAYCQCHEGWTGKNCDQTNACYSKSICAHGGKCFVQNNATSCICPLGYFGADCYARFDPCKGIACKNGGICVPLDERLHINFICSCPKEFFGTFCQHSSAHASLDFSSIDRNVLLPIVFVHFLELRNETPGVLFTQNRFMFKQVSVSKRVLVSNEKQVYLSPFIFVRIFFASFLVEYYLVAIIKRPNVININTTILPSHRCPHINELANETIRRLQIMKKVKYYHQICRVNTQTCFIDDAHICFCTHGNIADCFVFQYESEQCPTDYCQNEGRCVYHSYNGVWDFGCVCKECTYGSLCQLGTNQYVLSLDMMLAADIIEDVSITKQPILLKLTLSVVILMIIFGFISNVLSLITFYQPKTREFGCGFFLFYLSIVGQCGLLSFGGRFVYILVTQLHPIQNQNTALYTCVILEYLLSVFPTLFDWLTTCVAIDRTVNIFKGVLFSRIESVRWAKRVIPCLSIVICLIFIHELFIRQLTDDPRSLSHPWCVIKFSHPFLKYYRLTVNVVNLGLPVSINLIATVYLVHKTTRRKQTFATSTNEKDYFTTLKKQCLLYGSPMGVILLGLTRLIFSFTLVCIRHNWQKYIYLSACFISFVPLMSTFPIFVLPGAIYKKEFDNFIRRTRQNRQLLNFRKKTLKIKT